MCIVGLAAGFSAFLLKGGIRLLTQLCQSWLNPVGPNWILFCLPAAGVALAIVMQKYIFRSDLETGTGQVKTHLKEDNPYMAPSLMYSPLMANAVTLGFGGSAGAEGPIAFSSAAVASNLARRFHISPVMMGTIIGCGAGAGIAAIFKAPIGGMLFALEVIGLPVTTPVILGLLLSCLIAGLSSFIFGGSIYPFDYSPLHTLEWGWLPWLLLLGLFCGSYSWFYRGTGNIAARVLGKINSIWLRGLLSSAFLGGLLFLFPAVWGEGFGVVNILLKGEEDVIFRFGLEPEGIFSQIVPLLLILGGITLTKGALTSVTNHGGGVGGSFAPTLFAGCVSGFLFTMILNYIPGVNLPVSEFAFIAMSGVMAGVIRAPFMAMFLAPEMSGNFHLFLPCVLVCTISWLWERFLENGLNVKRG